MFFSSVALCAGVGCVLQRTGKCSFFYSYQRMY